MDDAATPRRREPQSTLARIERRRDKPQVAIGKRQKDDRRRRLTEIDGAIRLVEPSASWCGEDA